MNPHNHPPKIKSVTMDQLPTPRTEAAQLQFLSAVGAPGGFQFARTLERELLASQERLRVLRSALEKFMLATETCVDHCYSDGTVHHQSFDALAIGAAILEVRGILADNHP